MHAISDRDYPHDILFEDAVTSISDITYERVSYVHRLQFGGVDELEAVYVVRNASQRAHCVAPIGIRHWEKDRYSKRVVDNEGAHLPFLGSETIREVMAEAAARSVRDAERIFRQVDTPSPAVETAIEAVIAAIAAPLSVHDETGWRDHYRKAFLFLLDGVDEANSHREKILQRIKQGSAEHEALILANEVLFRRQRAFDILCTAGEGYYYPLVILRSTLEPEESGRAKETRAFVEVRTPVWLGEVPAPGREARELLKTLPSALGDAFRAEHSSHVSFKVSEITESAHMRIVSPRGTFMLAPIVLLPDGFELRTMERKASILNALERDAKPNGWKSQTREDFRLVRRRDHIRERASLLAETYWDENPPERADLAHLQGTAVSPWQMTYSFRARYREPLAVYWISILASLATVITAGLIGADVVEADVNSLGLVALLAAIWFGGHEDGLRRILTLRFGITVLVAFCTFTVTFVWFHLQPWPWIIDMVTTIARVFD